MLSRVAENVYWLSRYLERIENTARLVNVYSRSLMDMPNVESHKGWMPLISISGLDDLYLSQFDRATEADVTSFIISEVQYTVCCGTTRPINLCVWPAIWKGLT